MSNVGKIAKAQRVIAGLMSLILGKKSTVEWGRSAACGEDGVIGLPRPKTGDAEEIALLTRLAVHEAGHDKHTDFTAVEGLDGNVMALMNALEDPRIEREQVKSFPGAGLILNRGLEDSIRMVDAALDPSNPAHSADLVTVNVLLKGYRKLVPHEAMKSGADGLVAKGDQLLGGAGVAAVDQAIDRLAACKSTAEAAALAQELWQSLQPEEPERQDQQSTDTPDQQDQQEQNDTGESDQVDPESTPESDAPKTGESEESEKSPQAETSENPESPPQGESNSGNDPVDDTADAGGDADGTDGQPSESQPEANGNAQKEEPSPSGDGAADEGEANQDSQSDSGAASSQPQTGSPNADGQENSPHDAHNQESGGGGSTPNAEKGENPDGGTGQASKFDLSAAKGGDLGTLLEMAYEQKFGKPDVDAPGQPVEATTATDDMTKLVAAALEQASDDGESLEKALELIEAALEVVSSSEQDENDDDAQPSSGAGGGNATGVGTALDAKANLNGAVSRLVRIFTKELQDKRRRNVKLAPAGGLVASNRVWRLSAMGDTNVFRVTTSTGGIDAAVMVFLDRSASMGPCIVDAAKAALACTQALERISKVKTSIEMFPGFAGDVGSTVTLQAFGQSARQVVKRVSEVDAEGGTPLAEALHEAIPRLLAQRVKKRFAFLITDGIPNNKVAALAEIEKAAAMGVEFVGIGIGEYGVAIEGLTSVAAEIYNHGDASKDDGSQPRRVHVVVDEWRDAACEPMIQQANKGRGAGFFIWAMGQTFSDLVDKFGGNTARARTFIGNMNNLIVGATQDPDTMNLIIDKLGETSIIVKSQSSGMGSKTEDVGLEFSANQSESVSEKTVEIFPRSLLPQLQDLHYIGFFNRGELIKGRIPVIVQNKEAIH